MAIVAAAATAASTEEERERTGGTAENRDLGTSLRGEWVHKNGHFPGAASIIAADLRTRRDVWTAVVRRQSTRNRDETCPLTDIKTHLLGQ